MVVVAVLGGAHLPLKAQHLGPVFAEGTIHGICALQDFQEAILKRAENLRMVPQVGGMEQFHLRVVRCHSLAVLPDAAHQHARKQEIREHHETPIAQFHHLLQARLHQRKGDS
jgi:hypothetical protein